VPRGPDSSASWQLEFIPPTASKHPVLPEAERVTVRGVRRRGFDWLGFCCSVAKKFLCSAVCLEGGAFGMRARAHERGQAYSLNVADEMAHSARVARAESRGQPRVGRGSFPWQSGSSMVPIWASGRSRGAICAPGARGHPVPSPLWLRAAPGLRGPAGPPPPFRQTSPYGNSRD